MQADTHTFTGTFTHTLSDGNANEEILVCLYDTSAYVGGTMTVWMGVETDLTNNYGVAEYAIASHDADGSSSANMTQVKHYDAAEGLNPITQGAKASIKVGSPNQVELMIYHTVAPAFPTGTKFTGRFRLSLLPL